MKIKNDLKQEWTKQQIEEAVTFVRLELYNRDLPCGPIRYEKDYKNFIVSNRCRLKGPLPVYYHEMA